MKGKLLEFNVARTIKILRIELGEKQIVFANALQTSHSDYCKLENGQKRFKITELLILSQILGISVDQIFALSEIMKGQTQHTNDYGKLMDAYKTMQLHQKHSVNFIQELKQEIIDIDWK